MAKRTIEQSFAFGSQEINYELSFQERKTLGIRIYPDCKVRVIAPMDTSSEKVDRKLRKKAPWILKQQLDFLSYHPFTPPRKYISGETHLYLGRQYRLRIEKSTYNEVKLRRGRLIVLKNETASTKDLLNAWYRKKAQLHFDVTLQRILPRFSRYGIKKPRLYIRRMPTRWGSCTPKGRIILNPELIKAPKLSIAYVVIHELCHLIHYRHTKAFYELQTTMMPQWKTWKERLEHTLK